MSKLVQHKFKILIILFLGLPGLCSAQSKFFYRYSIDNDVLKYAAMPNFKQFILTYTREDYPGGGKKHLLLAKAYSTSNISISPAIPLQIRGSNGNAYYDYYLYNSITIKLTKVMLDNNGVEVDGKYIISPFPDIENGRACVRYLFDDMRGGPECEGVIGYDSSKNSKFRAITAFVMNPAPPF